MKVQGDSLIRRALALLFAAAMCVTVVTGEQEYVKQHRWKN
jgi:hypothetical protein